MSSSPPDPLERIAEALATRMGVTECPDLAGLDGLLTRSKGDGAGFVVGKRLRIDGYYDLEPSVTIYDPTLGTLGLVEHVSRDAADAGALTLKAIERAAAIRQIFIEAAERQSRGTVPLAPTPRLLPLQVELVLVVTDTAAGGDPVRTTLTSVARHTGYLRLIGVSVIDAAAHPGLEDAILYRAFPWLLRGTRKWFNRPVFHASSEGWRTGTDRLELSLTDYRMAGARRFTCDGSAWLNLIHGHNGSGKSSLAEAVELMLTSRIQRLDEANEENYFRVLRHRPKGVTDADLEGLSPATVVVSRNQTDNLSSVRIEYGEPPVRTGRTPRSGLQVNSFRVDQVFMDKLIRSDAVRRAAILLDAFSTGESTLLTELQHLRTNVRAAWQALPEHVRRRAELQLATTSSTSSPATLLSEEKMAEIILRDLGPLVAAYPSLAGTPPTVAEDVVRSLLPALRDDEPFPVTALESLLPGERKEMAPLGHVQPSVIERMEAMLNVKTAAGLPNAVTEFQSSLVSLSPSISPTLADVGAALRVFQEFRSWNATGRVAAGEDFEADLRRWLDLQALVDLMTKYGDVAATIEAAKRLSWEPDEPDRDTLQLEGGGLSQTLATRKSELIEALNLFRGRVESPKGSAAAEAAGPPHAREQVRRSLSPPEAEALNRAGVLLASTRGTEPLGVRLKRALARDMEETLADGSIGRPGGLDSAIQQASELSRACQLVQQAVGIPGLGTVPTPLERAGTAIRAALDFTSKSTALPGTFFHRLTDGSTDELTDLLAAFNEMLALITPARWAYRDIRLKPGIAADGKPEFGFHTVDGAPANLLFNTAELNASALVLFLLLAPRQPNDLRLMVLDDPLGNMDEITVVTLARALAKLHIIYPPNWMLLAFFHGEQHVQRIREEAPCHVYRLPWLQSSASGDEGRPIESVAAENTAPADWQLLSDVVTDPAPARATPTSASTSTKTRVTN